MTPKPRKAPPPKKKPKQAATVDSLKRPEGRPPAWKSVEELQSKIDQYKEYLKTENKPPTIAGLSYYIGVDRQTVYNYKAKDEYFGTIKRFVDWIIMTYEETSLTSSSAGIIFLMKNYGYNDKQEIESVNVNFNAEMSEDEAEEILKKYKDSV